MRSFALKLLVFMVSCAFSLLLLDVAFRSYERSFLIHELDPSVSIYDLAEYKYNDYERLLESRRAPGETRILSLGDSFAQSPTLPQYAYAHLIQRTLSDASREGRFRVVNLGRPGTSFPDYASQYRVWSSQVEFDGVLFNLYSGNDFFGMRGVVFVKTPSQRRDQSSDRVMRYGPGVDIPRKFRLRFVDYVYALYYSLVYRHTETDEAEFYRPQAIHQPHGVYLAAQSRQVSVFRLDHMESYFDAYFWLYKLLLVAKQIEDQGVYVAVTIAPPHFVVSQEWGDEVLANAGVGRDEILLDLPAMVVRALAREVGFQGVILDLAPCLREASRRGETVYWGTNSHWSVRGNQIVGDVISTALKEHWFPGRFHQPNSESTRCPTSIPSAPREVVTRVAESVTMIRDLLQFEETTMAALLGARFDGREDVASALERAGYGEARERIQGAFRGFQANKSDRIIRPHGMTQFVRPIGWAADADHLGESVFIVFLHGGRVIGIGRTREVPGSSADSMAHVAGLGPSTPNVLFHSLIQKPAPPLANPSDLWVLAISPGGRFAWLDYEPEL